MNQIRLLQVVTSYQSVVTILHGKLGLLGRRSDVVCHVASSADPAEPRTPAVPHFAVQIPRSIRPWQDLKAVARLKTIITENGYNIVHTHTAKAGIIGALAAYIAKTPSVHTYHGLPFYEGQGALAYRFYRILETAVSFLRKAVFCQTWCDAQSLKRLRIFGCRVYYEGNGVDVAAIVDSAEKNGPSAEALFAGPGAKILCVSRLEPVKNLSMVIDAAVRLRQEKTAFRLILAGKGVLEGRLKREIRGKGLAGCVSIRYTPHIHALVNKADIVVLSSVKEGIPRGLMEAMALKKPVVATDVAGTNELVVEGVTGFLVPLNDQEAFTERIVRLINDPELRKRMGQEGFARIQKEFNESAIVDAWCGCYRRILG